jgi:ParB family chromosome partitioning protein
VQTKNEIRKLKDLKATNPYLRMGTDVSDLEKSISTVGLIAPLVISADNIILAGARRYQALLNLGYTEAAVVIIDKGELEKELISIDENLVRKDLTKVEIEGHLRRAKEIYEALNPQEEVAPVQVLNEDEKKARKEILPSEKFLKIVAEKTGLSPKQIHEAINRDSLASSQVKAARQKGELSISQTNEIVKLNAEDQRKSLGHLKSLPVKEIKKFVKAAKAHGVDDAIKGISNLPHAREFNEIENILKRLQKKLKQLEIEGIDLSHFPESTREIFEEVASFSTFAGRNVKENDLQEDHHYS